MDGDMNFAYGRDYVEKCFEAQKEAARKEELEEGSKRMAQLKRDR